MIILNKLNLYATEVAHGKDILFFIHCDKYTQHIKSFRSRGYRKSLVLAVSIGLFAEMISEDMIKTKDIAYREMDYCKVFP